MTLEQIRDQIDQLHLEQLAAYDAGRTGLVAMIDAKIDRLHQSARDWPTASDINATLGYPMHSYELTGE
jgi:hypothetical protein